MKTTLISLCSIGLLSACAQQSPDSKPKNSQTEPANTYAVEKSDAEWKALLDPQSFHVLREKGTERPWTSPLLEVKEDGVFHCKACDNPLFVSNTKFESGTGWPSFFEALDGQVEEETDGSHGMLRSEILCSNCGGHLGHVFDDGPAPTGLRYCVNGLSLEFEKK